MRIVVTGAAGFIASNLIPRLLAEGHEVLGLDNFFLGQRAYLAPFEANANFRFVEVDLTQLEAVASLFADFLPERVWHLAANSDISYGTTYTDFDLKGGTLVTYAVLEAMRRHGTKEILFSSSGAVYGEPKTMPTPENYGPLFPISLYAASKLACEGLVSAFAHNYGFQAWIFRFGNIIGPNPTHGVIYDFVRRLLADPSHLNVLGDGTQSKPYVHVSDCLDGMMFAHAHARESLNCYNLAVPDHTSVREIADWTLAALGLADVTPAYAEGSRGWTGDVPIVRLDTRRLTALGWQPKLGSNEAVQRTIRELVLQLRAAASEAPTRA